MKQAKRAPVFVLAMLVGLTGLSLEAYASKATKNLKKAAQKLSTVTGFVPPDDARMAQAEEMIKAVGEQDDADAAKTLLGLLQMPYESASVEVTITEYAHDALKGTTKKGAHDVVRGMLKKAKKHSDMVVTLAEIVGAWQEPESAQSLVPLLESKNEQIVIAAARGLGNLRLKDGIDGLINVYGDWRKRGGEPIDVIGKALYDITGQALVEEADWKKWWGDSKADWTPESRTADSGDSDTSTRDIPKHWQKDDPPAFNGELKVTSKRVVIILDVSGSMHIRQYVESDEPKGGGENVGGGTSDDTDGQSLGGSDAPKLKEDPNKDGYKPKKCTFHQCPGAKGTGPECPSDEKLPKYYSRMKRLSRQIAELVKGFKGGTKFNMVSYSTAAKTWKGAKLITATPGNKAKAQKWIKALEPGGATRSDLALELAFQVAGADTFIFVTDGAPTNPKGRPYPAERWRELLDKIKRKNRKRKIRIDVVAIADGHTDFAVDLADENRGEYLTVD